MDKNEGTKIHVFLTTGSYLHKINGQGEIRSGSISTLKFWWVDFIVKQLSYATNEK